MLTVVVHVAQGLPRGRGPSRGPRAGSHQNSGGPRRPQEIPGSPRRHQEAAQEARAGPRRFQEAPGNPRKPQEVPGGAPGGLQDEAGPRARLSCGTGQAGPDGSCPAGFPLRNMSSVGSCVRVVVLALVVACVRACVCVCGRCFGPSSGSPGVRNVIFHKCIPRFVC